MVDNGTPVPLNVHEVTDRRTQAEPLALRSLVEFIAWALFTLGDLFLSMVMLVNLLERAAHGEVRLWEPVACSAIGFALLFVVGCYAMSVTAPRRARPRGGEPPG